eukprot:Opistho-2@36191
MDAIDVEDELELAKSIFKFDSGVAFSVRFAETFRGTFYDGNIDNTGMLIWPEALFMAEYLSTSPPWMRGRSVVELGSGTGACGIAAAVSVPLSLVVMTDREDSSLTLIQKNIADNTAAFKAHDVQCRRLEWGESTLLPAVSRANGGSHSPPATPTALGGSVEIGAHSSQSDITASFDIIIGAGVIYPREDADIVHLLFDTVALLLRRPCAPGAECGEGGENTVCGGGVFLCSYVQRNPATTQWMMEAASKHNLSIAHIATETFSSKRAPMDARLLAFYRSPSTSHVPPAQFGCARIVLWRDCRVTLFRLQRATRLHKGASLWGEGGGR